MKTTQQTIIPQHEPAVYVGTYEKYNNGSIGGGWMSLEGHDKESFYAACAELHSDESDPEFMFQDFQNFPREFYGESGLAAEIWDWLELDEDDVVCTLKINSDCYYHDKKYTQRIPY